jgi:hypothetical protein
MGNQAHAIPDDAPPPYSAATASNAPTSTPTPAVGPSPYPHLTSNPSNAATYAPQIARQFPPAFNVYSQAFSSEFLIGEHQSYPIYVMKIHSGFSGNPPIVLHSGPNSSLPPLAAVDYHAFSSRMTVTLPPPPGAGITSSQEDLEGNTTGLHRTYAFSIEAGPFSGRREQFEWRHSYGDAVSVLDGSLTGWKLVRLETGPPPGAQGMTFTPGGYIGSDGREVVAVWANAAGSMSKAAKFAFLGTGASGILGERWAIMAVMTAMGMFIRARRARNSN